MAKEKFSLKDALFNPPKVHQLGSQIKAVYGVFDQEGFEKDVVAKFPELELKERIVHISVMLREYLPKDYEEALKIIIKALPEPLDESKSDDDFGEFIYSVYGEFVRERGCCERYLDISLDVLREITKRFSVEYAIRDFINCFPDETEKMLESCSLSENYHERRLASEGLRPKLPWAKKLTIAHERPLSILDKLYADKTRFVTRSVANHLNDISKIDPVLTIETLKRWRSEDKQERKEMEWMTKHALRTLVKQGNSDALTLLGYTQDPEITVAELTLESDTVAMGEALVFSSEIKAKAYESLLIDYVIHFQTKAGKLSPKVFKIKKYELMKDEVIKLQKQHPFKYMSTRKLYAGAHRVELQINGKIVASKQFTLSEKV